MARRQLEYRVKKINLRPPEEAYGVRDGFLRP
jgi:hypothetical protein